MALVIILVMFAEQCQSTDPLINEDGETLAIDNRKAVYKYAKIMIKEDEARCKKKND